MPNRTPAPEAARDEKRFLKSFAAYLGVGVTCVQDSAASREKINEYMSI